MKTKLTGLLLTVILIISCNQAAFCQEKIEKKKEEKNFNFVPVPYVSYNRTYELMFGGVPMIMYNVSKKDTISPQSLSGAMGVYTTNETWFSAFFTKLYLNEDKWRILFGAGLGNMNSQFLQSAGTDQFTNIQTGADFLKLEVKRKIVKGVYLGGSYLYTKFDNEYKYENPIQEEITLNGLGLVLLWDKRDDVYNPTMGHKANLNITSYPSFMGNDNESNEVNLEYNKFISSRNKQNVWAFRTYGAFGLGDVPFNNLIVMGGRGADLRGYSQGEYRGKQLLATQTEYRYKLSDKMGLVGFVGAGTIFESNIESNNGTFLPSIGAGYRFMAFPKNKMNVGIDVAAGKNDWGMYFRIGESF
ncbi:outer membrane protein assembly factor [Flavobacteriaceae bacterium]|nr:outer membrane protein assembly factor [Flavobacteriaceae bacterium]